MTKKITFSAQNRTLLGKKTKNLRRAGLLPANISGHTKKPVAISIKTNNFEKMYAEAGETSLVFLQVEGETEVRPTLIDEVTFDPMTEQPLHVVFKQVDLSQKIEAEVAVVLTGENSVPGGVIVKTVDTVLVEALPSDLPENFTLDIAQLTEIGQTINYSDLVFDRTKVELKVSEEQLASPLVILQEQKEEVVEEPAPEAAAAETAAPATDTTAPEAAEKK